MSLFRKLTKDVHNRDARREAAALIQKWRQTGLLEGLEGTHESNMAILLENQAKQILTESTTMAGGDVEGYSAVAFPMVRRIFSKAIATKIVAVQPMSLPAGLIFFIDFTYNTSRLGNVADESIYGGSRVGAQITGGVLINDTGTTRHGEKGYYAMNYGYSSATGSISGLVLTESYAPFEIGTDAERDNKAIRSDVDLLTGSYATVLKVPLTQTQWDRLAGTPATALSASLIHSDSQEVGLSGSTQVRRLTTFDAANRTVSVVFHATSAFNSLTGDGLATLTIDFPRKDPWSTPHLGAIVGTSPWELEGQPEIPEIDIKVNSIPVTAQEKKLKAKWTHEVGQDLNAFHNIDAEAELTTVLSDQIELEMNYEILTQLVAGATGGTYFWSARPGKFLDMVTGEDRSSSTAPPDFTGNVWEWDQTLMKVINFLSAQIHRKVRKGGANFIVCNPETAALLEGTAGYVAETAVDDEMGSAGSMKIGTLRRRWEVYVDPNFYRNVLLVGRKGAGFLESGFVHAPYVPLIVHPTILHTEDFTPRKAVMTRYANQMVLPDYYGLVVIQDLLG